MSSTDDPAPTEKAGQPPGRAELRRFLAAAVLNAVCEEPELLEDDAHEISMMFRIGWCLVPMIERDGSDLRVDCEFNRMTDAGGVRGPKRAPDVDTKHSGGNDHHCGTRPDLIRPDLIVHRRGYNDLNLLVVEARKKKGLGDNLPGILNRLRGFRSETGLSYQHAVAVVLSETPLWQWVDEDEELVPVGSD
ncbi:hypothetical protein [Nocardia sp. NPDC060259]|uniref:hypothetical protein n=1 Tax=Nocardia sp. NPDC060259 TaxID=3347088 RepID=UPI00365A5A8A